MRLDQYVQNKLNISRAKAQKLIKGDRVLVNGKVVRSSYSFNERDKIVIEEFLPKEVTLHSEEGDLDIVYEDKDCFVVNKPANMVVHPGEGSSHQVGTLANLVLKKVQVGVGGEMRPGIVHRLDKDTSGLLIVAKTQSGYDNLIKQFKQKRVRKYYLALVCGKLEHCEGIIEAAIGRSIKDRKKMSIVTGSSGKEAQSRFKLKEVFNLEKGIKASLVEVEIFTGRTHQIRLHMKSIGHSVVGDITYGNKNYNRIFIDKFGLDRQFLHAYKLQFRSPDTGKLVKKEINLPLVLENLLSGLALGVV